METRHYVCRGRILVVDQDDWCRDFLTQVIKLIGFEEFRLTATVDEALAALEESSYDLVITDFTLPGYQALLESCSQRFPATHFILMVHQREQTSRAMARRAEEATEVAYQWIPPSQGRGRPGFSPPQIAYLERMEIVIKPLTLDEMACKIRDAIRRRHRLQVEEEMRRLKAEVLRLLR